MSVRVIRKESMIDLLLALEKDKSFIELKACLNMSPNTILARLREAQKDNLVDQIFIKRENKKPIVKYTLTEKGRETLALFIPFKTDFLSLKKELNELENKVRQKKKNIKLLLSSILIRT